MAEFTQSQKIAAEVYGGGDYHERWSDMAEFEEAVEMNEVGDTLFVFIMRELEETSDTLETAANAMERARDELEEVRVALEAATMEGSEDDEAGDGD